MKSFIAVSLLAIAVTMSACGSGGEGAGQAGDGSHQHMEAMVPGSPADPGQAESEIEIKALDDLRFEPASVEVDAGEVVTFVVTNEGKTEHEFVLGDEAFQEMHETDMQDSGHHMMDMDNGVTVAPGQTAELTWRFDDPGEVLFGCHEPGHYDGGMVGTITVG